jgi:hypothetical protein
MDSMEGLTPAPGFARWRPWGSFDCRPPAADSGLIVVEAWRD